MNVYWLEQNVTDVPLHDDWLSPGEKASLNAMRFPKRRADWLLGRWTAKRALSFHLNARGDPQALASIEVRPAASGAPEIFVADQPDRVGISISHRNGNALCAIAPFGAALGCDLELVEPRSDAFVTDYFTREEQALVAQAPPANRPFLVTLLWSAKESALKALHEGLRFDTRSVLVSLPEGVEPPKQGEEMQLCSRWRPLEVHCSEGEVFHGWWRQAGDVLRTLVAAPAPSQPMALRITK
jgi:4'-phosphopantetheinyl transferase